MKHSLTILFSLILFSQINLKAQELPRDCFHNNIEIYFSFDVSSVDLIRQLTNAVSIDNVNGKTVYAYANQNEYNDFLSYKLPHQILQKPGKLIIPEMSDNIDEITDWNVYPTYAFDAVTASWSNIS